MKNYSYKVAMISENRATDQPYVDKVITIEVEQRQYSRTAATDKIHKILGKTYDTKSRRYKGFEWVVSTSDLK